MPWLLICRPWNPATGALTTLYFSDAGFVTEPGDSPANTYFERRLEVPLRASRSLFSGTDLSGRSETAVGDIVLANLDAALDGLADLGWDGREVELRYTDKAAPVLADFATVMVGTAEGVTVDDEVTIDLRDRTVLLDQPFQGSRFAGTGGAEGEATLKDTRKPRALGFPVQCEGVLLTAAGNQVLAFGDGPIGGVRRLTDRGVVLLPGPDYPTYAALVAASVTGWGYLTCDALGLVMLGVATDGPVTADLAGRTRGENLVTDPGFAAGLAAGATASATVPTGAGRWYVLRALVTRSAGAVQPGAGGALGAAVSVSQRIVREWVATGSSTTISFAADGAWSGSVTAVEVVEVLARAGDLAEWVVDADTDLAPGDFAAGTVAALNALCPQPLGHYHGGGEGGRVTEWLDLATRSIGGWWGIDRAGRVELGRFDGPKALPDFAFNERQIRELRPAAVAPRVKRTELVYAPRWRRLSDGDVAASVTGAAREALVAPHLVAATPLDAAVALASPLAVEDRIETILVRGADADAEASRQQAIFGARRTAYSAEVPLTAGLDVCATVELAWPRWGLAAGKRFVVVASEPDALGDGQTLTVWG